MSVPNQTPYNIYTANGLSTVFAYEFYLISASDIRVTINGSEVSSGYTVSGVGNTRGGEVTFLTVPANGATVIFERVTPTYRLTDYQDNGDLLADTVNKDFDRLWMAIQRAFIYLGVALTRPLFGGGPFNANGYRIENLADPVNDQDAATKKFVIDHGISNLAKTLRVPEASVSVLPSAEDRAWKGLGFDGAGQPKLQDPAGTGLWGYVPAIGSFEKGSLLTQRFEVLLWESTDEYWRWDGAMPKIVLPGSTPATAGGTGKGKWIDVTDATLRAHLGSGEEGFGDYLVTHRHKTGYTAPLNTFLNDAINYVFPEAFGTEYNEVRLQAAIDYAVDNGLRLVATNRNFTINAQIIIPTKLNADFTGTVITAGPAISSGAAAKVDGVASVSAGQYAGTIHNFTLIRALVSDHADTSSNVDGISFNGATGQASDTKWYNLQVYGFRDGLRFDGPNTYLNHFILPRIGFGWRRGVAVYASVNSNENHGFDGGSIFNINNTSFDGVGVYVDPAASTSEIYMSKTSIDYCDVSAYLSLGRLNLNSCHLENNNNNPHIILNYTAGKEKPTVVAVGGLMAGGPGITSWTKIPVEDAGGRPSIIYAYNAGSVFVHLYGVKTGDYKANVIRNTQILKIQNNNADVIASFKCEPIIDAGNTVAASRPLRICNAINTMYINAYTLQAWKQSVSRDDGTITFSTDVSVYYDADSAHSRKYVGTAGFSTGIYQEINCLAGKHININMFAKVTSLSAGYAALRCDFIDANNNVIFTDLKTITSVSSDWEQLWVYRKVPNGAVKVRIQEYYNGFTGTAYFSNENTWFH